MYGIIEEINYLNLSIKFLENYNLRVVGVSKTNNPTIYMNYNLISSIAFDLHKSSTNGLKIITSDIASKFLNINDLLENEIIIFSSEFERRGMDLSKDNYLNILDQSYKIVTTYNSENLDEFFIMKADNLKELNISLFNKNFDNFSIVTKNKEQVMNNLIEKILYPVDDYSLQLFNQIYCKNDIICYN